MQKVENQMAITAYLRDFLRNLTHPNGQRRFQILDGGDVRITANLVPNNKDFFLIVCAHPSRLIAYQLYLGYVFIDWLF